LSGWQEAFKLEDLGVGKLRGWEAMRLESWEAELVAYVDWIIMLIKI